MSDGRSATTNAIIEIPHISDPVMEVQNYPPATQFRDESRFPPRCRVRLLSGNKDRAQSEAMRENGSRSKDKYSNRPTKETANQHFLLITLNSFLPVVAGSSVLIRITVTSISIASSYNM